MTDMQRYWVTDVDLYDSTDDGSHQPEAQFGVDYADIEVVLASDAEAAIVEAFQAGMDQMIGGIEQVSYEQGQRDALAAAVQRVEDFEYVTTIGVVVTSIVPKAEIISLIKGDQP